MGKLVGSLLGLEDPTKAGLKAAAAAPRIGIDAGGLKVTPTGNTVTATSSPERLGQVRSLADVFGLTGQQAAQLTAQLDPLSGRAVQTTRDVFGSRLRAATGNLRENLQRRRILGSSFANRALAQLEAEFAEREAAEAAKIGLASAQLQQAALAQQAQLQAAEFQTFLNNMNLESNLAANLATGVQQVTAQAFQAGAEGAAKSNAGIGQLAGTLLTAPLGGTVLGKAFGV